MREPRGQTRRDSGTVGGEQTSWPLNEEDAAGNRVEGLEPARPLGVRRLGRFASQSRDSEGNCEEVALKMSSLSSLPSSEHPTLGKASNAICYC